MWKEIDLFIDQGAALFIYNLLLIPLVFSYTKLHEMVVSSEPYKNRGEINVEFTDKLPRITTKCGQCLTDNPRPSRMGAKNSRGVDFLRDTCEQCR
jgi:hypothetical protein